MVMASPGFSLLKSTFGLASLMALTGRPYISAIVAALSPGPSTINFLSGITGGSGGSSGGSSGGGGASGGF